MTEIIIKKDSKEKKYRLVNDTAYSMSTLKEIIDILEESRVNKTRLIFDFGDPVTGRSWQEENDTIGHVGRSTGVIKIPLLIKTNRSYGGGALLDHCIVKITSSIGKKVLYKHHKYH